MRRYVRVILVTAAILFSLSGYSLAAFCEGAECYPAGLNIQVGESSNWVPGTMAFDKDDKLYYWFQGSLSDQDWRVDFSGAVYPEPSIVYGIAASNFSSNPLNFSFLFSVPLLPAVGNPNVVQASMSYSLTDGTDNGISFLPTGSRGFVQQSDVGVPFTSMGVDLDNAGFSALGGGSGNPISYNGVGAFNTAVIAGPFAPPGGWVVLQTGIAFSLTGNRDVATANGGASINQVPVPEPLTLILLGLGLGGLTLTRREK